MLLIIPAFPAEKKPQCFSTCQTSTATQLYEPSSAKSSNYCRVKKSHKYL